MSLAGLTAGLTEWAERPLAVILPKASVNVGIKDDDRVLEAFGSINVRPFRAGIGSKRSFHNRYLLSFPSCGPSFFAYSADSSGRTNLTSILLAQSRPLKMRVV